MSIENPDIGSSNLTQKATRDGSAHGLLLWFDAEIADGIYIHNDPGAAKVAEVYGCAFFPLLEPVSIAKGDTITLSVQADLVEDEYNWRWRTHIQSGDKSRTIKADYQQSTDLDSSLERAVLHESVLNFKPSRGEAGEIDHFILGQMDGGHTIDQIARQTQEKYPVRFKNPEEAHLYVNELSQQYSL